VASALSSSPRRSLARAVVPACRRLALRGALLSLRTRGFTTRRNGSPLRARVAALQGNWGLNGPEMAASSLRAAWRDGSRLGTSAEASGLFRSPRQPRRVKLPLDFELNAASCRAASVPATFDPRGRVRGRKRSSASTHARRDVPLPSGRERGRGAPGVVSGGLSLRNGLGTGRFPRESGVFLTGTDCEV